MDNKLTETDSPNRCVAAVPIWIKPYLTIEEAAETSGIGRNTMRKLVDWGKLPVLKVGRKTIIRRDTLEHFMTVNQGRNLLCQDDVRKVE